MAVYLLADSEVHDPEAYEAYLEGAPAFVHKHGGEYLVRGGDFDVVHGDWKPTRIVMFRFPDRESIARFMADPDYQPLKAIREAATTAKNMLIMEGA
jgi:uncharacterized protein (DUF1330 family)